MTCHWFEIEGICNASFKTNLKYMVNWFNSESFWTDFKQSIKLYNRFSVISCTLSHDQAIKMSDVIQFNKISHRNIVLDLFLRNQ